MSETIIKLEPVLSDFYEVEVNISKQYRLGQVGIRVAERSRSQTLRGDLLSRRLRGVEAWWHTIRGKEDPNLKIGQTNQLNSKLETGNREQRTVNSKQGTGNSKPETDYVWALKDINLEVKQGEVLGIIGKN